MLDNLRQLLKDDIWKIIEGEEKPERDFFTYVLHMVLGNEIIKLKDVVELSKRLKNRYNQVLGEIIEYITAGNGEVLPALKELKNKYNDKVLPILNKIKEYKYVRKKQN